jgi:heme exporter protein B
MADAPVQPSFLRAMGALFARELRVELRTKSLLTSMGLFALLCIVIVGLGVRGISSNETYDRFVLAMLWVCTMFAAVVGLNRAAGSDRRKDFFGALLILPHDPGVVYFVRLVSTLAFLLLTQAIMIVVAVPLLKLDFFDQPLMLLIIPLADLGILAPGVLLSSSTSRVRGGEALLTIALLPVAVPVFAGATGATERLQGGGGFAGAQPYVLLLLVCGAMFTALGLLLYGRLNEG